jgi:hypothetical protein
MPPLLMLSLTSQQVRRGPQLLLLLPKRLRATSPNSFVKAMDVVIQNRV